MIYIAPSLFAADFSQLANEVTKVKKGGANMLHLDVMDGHFVPNMSFGAPVIAAIRKHSDIIFDVHLMISEPKKYLDDFIKAGADSITVHLECDSDTNECINYLEECNCKAGVALSPDTPAEAVFPYLDRISMVLVMTVYPGFGGQKFMPQMIGKIRAIRAEIERRGLNVDIQVDGGISADNVALVSEAGANAFVAGSAIFNAKKPGVVIKNMIAEAEAHPYKG